MENIIMGIVLMLIVIFIFIAGKHLIAKEKSKIDKLAVLLKEVEKYGKKKGS